MSVAPVAPTFFAELTTVSVKSGLTIATMDLNAIAHPHFSPDYFHIEAVLS
jgi:hypothetical protein